MNPNATPFSVCALPTIEEANDEEWPEWDESDHDDQKEYEWDGSDSGDSVESFEAERIPTRRSKPEHTNFRLNDKNEASPENIYDEKLSNNIFVTPNHALSHYIEYSQQIFRYNKHIFIIGEGHNAQIAWCVAQILQTQNFGTIKKITPFSVADNVMRIQLVRGKFGGYITENQQKKIIKIFENNDVQCKGFITIKAIESLRFIERFRMNTQQIKKANHFFIKYASICIHSLLKQKVINDGIAMMDR